MKLTRSIAVLGGLGVAAIALIGAGAGAVFTTSTTSSQTITAGTPNVTLTTPNGGASLSANGRALTLAPYGPVGSTFLSPIQTINVTNTGNIPVTEFTIQVSDTPNNSAGGPLSNEMSMCLTSDGFIMYNGLLASGESLITLDPTPPYVLSVGQSDQYTMQFYAGNEDAGCGTWSGWSSWQLGNFSAYPVTGTQDVWVGNVENAAGHPNYVGTPTPGTSSAGTLNNDAEGGIDTVTFTFNFTA
jgi:hypothetical protein